MIKACLFDLDGTLLNTLNSIRYYINKNTALYGISEISEDETKVFVGNGARKLVTNVLSSRGFDLSEEKTKEICEKILESYVKEYDDSPLYLTEPYNGIVPLVNELSEKKIKLAVISNKPDKTVKQLVTHFFGNIFDIVEGANERMPLKPDARWPIDICKRLGVDPSEVAYVGDTSTDMKTAVNFGAKIAIGVTWGFRDAAELWENGASVTVNEAKEIAVMINNENEKIGEE